MSQLDVDKFRKLLIINYFPMQTIILIDNQLVTASVVQIWFRKKGVYLVTNRTEN